jgi:hypothetical protein
LDTISVGYEIAPGIARYSKPGTDPVGAPGIYGLINIKTGKKITPLIYDRIREGGRATRTVDGERVECYIDSQTGQEYRGKIESK